MIVPTASTQRSAFDVFSCEPLVFYSSELILQLIVINVMDLYLTESAKIKIT